jgi:hypothetical protein
MNAVMLVAAFAPLPKPLVLSVSKHCPPLFWRAVEEAKRDSPSTRSG